MPNRILKESICTSATVDELKSDEEVFFYRLIVHCDDYGLMDARPAILRAKLFPLRVEKVTLEHVERYLKRLVDVGLIRLYVVDGQPYLQMITWNKHQQQRAVKSRYPKPSNDDLISPDINVYQRITTDSTCPRNPIQSNPNPNPNSNSPNGVSADTKAATDLGEDRKIWTALVDAGLRKPETSSERGRWNRGIKELRQAGVSADSVAGLVKLYVDRWPDMECSPTAIASNLGRLRSSLPNGHARDRPPPNTYEPHYLSGDEARKKQEEDEAWTAKYLNSS